MSFGESAFLAGLLAAAIPIVIHLLHRRRARRVRFPTLRFLRDVEVRMSRRRRIQELAILLLRAAAVVLLALALARPKLETGAAGHAAASRVVIVDNSLSMNARLDGVSALERSLLVARGLVQQMGAADRTAIIPIHGEPLPLTESRPDVERALAAVKSTYRDSPLLQAVEQALRMLEGDSNSLKEILFLSDLQASAFLERSRGSSAVTIPEGVRLVILEPAIDRSPNVTPLCSYDAVKDGAQIKVRLVSRGGEALARLRFSVDGKPVAERSVRIPGNSSNADSPKATVTATDDTSAEGRAGVEEAIASFHAPELPVGFHRAEVRIDDDVLPADNSIEIPLAVHEESQVIVAQDAPAAGRDPAYYLGRALLAGQRSSPRLQVQVLRTEQLASADLASAQVVFLVEPAAVGEAAGSALARFVLRGGGLFVSAGPRQDAAALDAVSRDGDILSPVVLGGVARADEEPLRLAAWDDRHPIWAPLLAASPPLRPGAPAFLAARQVRPRPGAEVLAKLSSGDPALVLGRAGEGKFLFFASTLSDEWTNLPLRFLFAPWIHSIVRYLAPSPPRPESFVTGAPCVVRHRRETGFLEAGLEGPDGKAASARATIEETHAGAPAKEQPAGSGASKESPEAAGELLQADLGILERPGVYFLTEKFGERSRRRVLTVMLPEEESDLRPLGETHVAELFPGAIRISFKSPRDALDQIAGIRGGGDLRETLLLVLLGLLVLEPLLANRTAFRRAREEADRQAKSVQASGRERGRKVER